MMQLDDIPITNAARDKAWENFIKRKDVKDYFNVEFPLHGWYQLWCQSWHRAWDAGFKDGWNAAKGEE